MSKERARRREEREREAAVQAAARAAEAERRERRTARKRALLGWLPGSLSSASRNRQSGILADRRRKQTGATIALVLAAALLTWVFTTSLAAVAFALVVGVLAAPVVHTMLFRRTP